MYPYRLQKHKQRYDSLLPMDEQVSNLEYQIRIKQQRVLYKALQKMRQEVHQVIANIAKDPKKYQKMILKRQTKGKSNLLLWNSLTSTTLIKSYLRKFHDQDIEQMVQKILDETDFTERVKELLQYDRLWTEIDTGFAHFLSLDSHVRVYIHWPKSKIEDHSI